MGTSAASSDAIRAKQVIGTSVRDLSGEKIGKVEDIVLDKLSNNIVFAIVASVASSGWVRNIIQSHGHH